MDKAQAIQNFWSSFGLPAYDSRTVPDNALLPYITYDVSTDSFENAVPLSGNIWYRSTSWESVTRKAEEIASCINRYGYYIVKIDDGYVWITKGTPFAQRMDDPDDSMMRRIYINIMVEFLTSY